jgi:phage shock protein PspC (stress-responsive transcriptional regulator)
MEKKLYKDIKNKKLAGVCAGLAEFLKMDVSLVRILWVVITLMGSLGLWIYIACALILPEKPEEV